MFLVIKPESQTECKLFCQYTLRTTQQSQVSTSVHHTHPYWLMRLSASSEHGQQSYQDSLAVSPFKQKHRPIPTLIPSSQVEGLVHVAHKVCEEADRNIATLGQHAPVASL